MPASATATVSADVSRPRPRNFRPIEKPPQHGEKPFAQLVEEAFEGPNLRISRRMRLLEEADTRKIRRGDALDVIDAIQRDRDRQFAILPRSASRLFTRKFLAFAAAYVVLAAAWCTVMALQS